MYEQPLSLQNLDYELINAGVYSRSLLIKDEQINFSVLEMDQRCYCESAGVTHANLN